METKSNHFNQEIQTEVSTHEVLAKEFEYDVVKMFPSAEAIAKEKRILKENIHMVILSSHLIIVENVSSITGWKLLDLLQ